jgi:hypothetical protein
LLNLAQWHHYLASDGFRDETTLQSFKCHLWGRPNIEMSMMSVTMVSMASLGHMITLRNYFQPAMLVNVNQLYVNVSKRVVLKVI